MSLFPSLQMLAVSERKMRTRLQSYSPSPTISFLTYGHILAVANLMKRKTNVGMFQGFIRGYAVCVSQILISLLQKGGSYLTGVGHRRNLDLLLSSSLPKTISSTSRIRIKRSWKTRELIFGLLEGLSLTSLISYSPSNHSLSLRIYPVKISRLSKGTS